MQEWLYQLAQTAHCVRPDQDLPDKPSTFGVYLGPLNNPPTVEEKQILSEWAFVVLDHTQPGVVETVNDDSIPLGPYIVARVDLLRILPFAATEDEINMQKAVYLVSEVVHQYLRKPDQRRHFTGVLLAGWRERVSTPLLNGLAKLFSAYGLDVYLEVGPPNFLEKVEKLKFDLFAGIVVRNGTILENGERRDFFAMDKMKTTTKAFVSQACLRPFLTMMWDTIDDDADLSHAVTRRAHMWCSYHGAIPYFVRRGALTDILGVRSCEEPLAAFQWLKDRRVMSVHEKFRTTRVVSGYLLLD